MPGLDSVQAKLAAYELFQSALHRGKVRKFIALITGRSRRLFELATVRHTCAVNGYTAAGRQRVLLSQIQGTESRVRDFDNEFYPLQAHDAER